MKRAVLGTSALLMHAGVAVSARPHSIAAASGTWQNVTGASTTSPTARSGQATASVAGGVVITGGCSSSCCFAPLSDAFLWTPQDGWASLNVTGKVVPGPRLYHTAQQVDATRAVVFGGSNVQGFFADTWLMAVDADTHTLAWTPINTPTSPAERAGHAMTPIPGSPGTWAVYGGANADTILSDLWFFSLSSAAWTLVSNASASPSPGARTQHSLTSVPASTAWPAGALILMGGSDMDGNDHADAWAFDLQSHTWVELTTSGAAPLPRHGHASWWADSLFVFGGQTGTPPTSPYLGDLWSLTTSGSAWTWTLLQNSTYSPSTVQPDARGLMGAAPATRAGVYLAMGFSGYEGGLDDVFHNDVWQWSA